MSQNQGCLSVFFGWLKVEESPAKRPQKSSNLSVDPVHDAGDHESQRSIQAYEKRYVYRLDRYALLSPAERSFFGVLRRAVGDQYVICPKVNMADLFWTPQQGARSRIDRKHVDFVLCSPDTMSPRIGIELDDSSHGSPSSIQRDEVKNEVFQAAGLPLLRVRVRSSYDVGQLSILIQRALSLETS